MKKCIACGNEQETGKFCGKCGTKFEEGVASISTSDLGPISTEIPEVEVYDTATPEPVIRAQARSVPPVTLTQPNEHVEKVKDQSKKFWNYFKKYTKNPSEIFATGDREFVNALISILVFAFILSVTVYVSISSFARSAMGGLGELGDLFMEEYKGPPFFTIFASVFMFTLVSAGLVVVSLLIINKLFGPANSWRETVSHYGTFIFTSSALAIIGLLLIIIKSFVFGNIIVILSYLMMLIGIPTFIIGRLLISTSKSVDKFYGYLLYIVLFAIIYSIYITIIADSTIGQVIDQLPKW